MKTKSLRIPFIILVVGLVLSVIAYLLSSVIMVPTITEHDFNFKVTYKLNGETQIIEGVYRSHFEGSGEGISPLERYYYGTVLTNESETHPLEYTIDKKDGLELRIVLCFSDDYLMGDVEEEDERCDPYLAVYDKDECSYDEEEYLLKFDAEIIDWVAPEPIANTFRFAGFAGLYDGNMLAMLFVGVLVIIASVIFVKKEENVSYGSLDKVSVLLNFVISFSVIPFFTLVTWLMQIFVSGDEIYYQLHLCLPALTAFTVAASISLRRKGFRMIGFFIQFIGPAFFVFHMALEFVITNWFM